MTKAVLATMLVAAALQPVFRSDTELVLVNVVVRDKTGAVVRGLKQSDFLVTEDGKPQTVATFDFEEPDRTEAAAAAPADQPPSTAAPPKEPVLSQKATEPPAKADMRGRRLIVLFFDLSSMEPEAVSRAVRAAHDYVDQKISPADLIAVASFSTSFRVDQDFTAERTAIDGALDRFGRAGSLGFEAGTTGDSDGTPDNGAAFTPDDTEFNIFTTDRRLDALQSLCDALSGIDQKKSVVYFSSGMSQNGQDNQVELRRTVDRANRANVSIYAADMRGLQAMVPGGEATQASTRGVSAFSGASVTNQFARLAGSQDTLTTIAEDTGGRAFFDSNSFGDVFQRVVADTSAYYVLGYSSTNAARDGRFRRISVRLKDSSVKLEYRSGYYAPRDFAHSTREDRDQQLQDQLQSDLPLTDLSTYVSAAYFRIASDRFFVPVSVVVPGYQVPFTSTTDANHRTIDVLGIVRDRQGRPAGRLRDTVRIDPARTVDLAHKTVQYETGLELAPGPYHVKVVVRENQHGGMGAFETDFTVPDLARDAVKMSSIVVGTDLQAAARRDDRNPLVVDGRELVPNVTHVVSNGRHLYFYYEVYDPGLAPAIRVVTSIAFFRGGRRVFETAPVVATALNGSDRKGVRFQFDVAPASLPAGLYTCQVNVVDDTSGEFTFPRLQLFVKR